MIYSLEKAEQMLPLLSRISHDLKSSTKKINQVLEDVEDEQERKEQLEKFLRDRESYFEELRKMNCSTPNVARGIIDVPVWHPHRSEVVHVMVNDRTQSEEDFLARRVDEAWNRGRGFWEL